MYVYHIAHKKEIEILNVIKNIRILNLKYHNILIIKFFLINYSQYLIKNKINFWQITLGSDLLRKLEYKLSPNKKIVTIIYLCTYNLIEEIFFTTNFFLDILIYYIMLSMNIYLRIREWRTDITVAFVIKSEMLIGILYPLRQLNNIKSYNTINNWKIKYLHSQSSFMHTVK